MRPLFSVIAMVMQLPQIMAQRCGRCQIGFVLGVATGAAMTIGWVREPTLRGR